MLIINYSIFVNYLMTNWILNFMFVLPVIITAYLIYLYNILQINFNYQLNELGSLVFVIYIAIRHYIECRTELDNFVT